MHTHTCFCACQIYSAELLIQESPKQDSPLINFAYMKEPRDYTPMISGGPMCILVHPDKLFIRGPFFWGLHPIGIDVISMETKPYLVEYWLQLKTETEHPGSNPEVHVYVHKACAKGIKTCTRRNNIVGIICNWIFPDHPDLRETALFGLSAVQGMLAVFLKSQCSPLPRLWRRPTFVTECFLS